MISIPSPRSTRRARIEIVPLIDIVFFLLATFVMVSLSMVKNRAIPVKLPGSETGAPQDRSEFTSITINEKGEIFLDKMPVDLDQLREALGRLIATQAEPKVFLSGDKKVEFGRAIAVFDLVRKSGITQVAIETESKHGNP
jgi:biopolymer transport protein ExbD